MNTANRNYKSILLTFFFFISTYFSHFTFAETNFEPKYLCVFGDSLSDQNNLISYLTNGAGFSLQYLLDGVTVTATQLPGKVFFHNRFTNGFTAIEHFAGLRGLPLIGFYQRFYSSNGTDTSGTNFAFSGAQIQSTGSGIDLPEQVTTYVSFSNHICSASNQGLTAILAGSNDIRNAIETYLIALFSNGNMDDALTAAQSYLNTSISAFEVDIMHALIDSGMTHFYIANVPDLGRIPEIIQNDAIYATVPLTEIATALTRYFNFKLRHTINKLNNNNPTITIYTFNLFKKFNHYLDLKTAQGFDVTEGTIYDWAYATTGPNTLNFKAYCNVNEVINDIPCDWNRFGERLSDFNQKVFWDNLHIAAPHAAVFGAKLHRELSCQILHGKRCSQMHNHQN